MSEQFDETFLSSLADDVVSDLFSSNDSVIVPEVIEEPTDDNLGNEPKPVDLKTSKINNPVEGLNTDDLLSDVLEDVKAKKPTPVSTGNEPVMVSNSLGFDVNDLYTDGTLLPFDGEDQVNTVEDLKALIKANKDEEVKTAKEQALTSYKESLPEAARLLLKYAENGGDEFSSIVKYLGASERQKDLNPDNVDDQREIVRQYYLEQEWSEEDIQDELDDLEDTGPDKLKDRALKLKPKVDAYKQKKIDAEIAKAEELETKRAQARETYVKSLTDTLSAGKLGGLEISKVEQKDIYNALISERYNSINGPTNRLGALLDKIQYIEPNFELLSKVVMYLSDEQGFEKKIAEKLKQEVTVDTVKKLKTQQGLKRTTTPQHGSHGRSGPNLTQAFKNPFE